MCGHDKFLVDADFFLRVVSWINFTNINQIYSWANRFGRNSYERSALVSKRRRCAQVLPRYQVNWRLYKIWQKFTKLINRYGSSTLPDTRGDSWRYAEKTRGIYRITLHWTESHKARPMAKLHRKLDKNWQNSSERLFDGVECGQMCQLERLAL